MMITLEEGKEVEVMGEEGEGGVGEKVEEEMGEEKEAVKEAEDLAIEGEEEIISEAEAKEMEEEEEAANNHDSFSLCIVKFHHFPGQDIFFCIIIQSLHSFWSTSLVSFLSSQIIFYKSFCCLKKVEERMAESLRLIKRISKGFIFLLSRISLILKAPLTVSDETTIPSNLSSVIVGP